MRRLWICAIALSGAACATNPPPVPVSGSSTEVSALAGEWVGEYRSSETARSGSISFTLKTGRDTAYGDVIMVPAHVGAPRMDPREAIPPAVGITEALPIRFVRVRGTRVTGSIEPYPAPDCECALLMTFRGELLRDRIEGTFTVNHSATGHAAQKGTWWVARKRVP